MNKWVYVMFGVLVLVIGIGLGVFFKFEPSLNLISKPDSANDWQQVESVVLGNCKKNTPLEDKIVDLNIDSYIMLVQKIDGVTYSQESGVKIPSNTKIVPFFVDDNDSQLACMVVYGGNNKGFGIVVYENIDGEILKLSVNDFPGVK